MNYPITISVFNETARHQVINAINAAAAHTGMRVLHKTQLLTASSELLSNMLKYAGAGEITISIEEDKISKKLLFKPRPRTGDR